MITASHFSWERTNGVLPANKFVLHTCDDPRCVNPAHLFLGGYKENAIDMVNKRRHPFGEKCGKAKLTWDQVRQIRAMHKPRKRGSGAPAIAKKFNISAQNVLEIIRGNLWKEENLSPCA